MIYTLSFKALAIFIVFKAIMNFSNFQDGGHFENGGHQKLKILNMLFRPPYNVLFIYQVSKL